jgi:hypothetical protein
MVAAGLFLRFRLGISRLDFTGTTTNIAAVSASSAAFFAVTEWNTSDGFFTSATTRKAGGRSLAVALRTQCFLRHLLMRLPRPPLLMDQCVDDQDYDDSAQNDHPIGKFSARYRCLFAKPFHDRPPILDVSKFILSALATPASVSALPLAIYWFRRRSIRRQRDDTETQQREGRLFQRRPAQDHRCRARSISASNPY